MRSNTRFLKQNNDCERNESFSNQVLFALGMGRGADATLTNLFNPTSGRDASHPCLISTWPKEWCTIVCVIMGGTNLSPFMSITNCNHPFAQIKDGLMSLPTNILGTSFQKNTFNHFHFGFRELRIYNVFLYGRC